MGCFSWLPTSRSTFDPTAGGSISYTIIKRKEKFNTLQNVSKIFLCASKKKQKQTYPESQVAQGRQGVRDTQIMRHEPPPRAIAPKSFNVAKLGRHPRIPVKSTVASAINTPNEQLSIEQFLPPPIETRSFGFREQKSSREAAVALDRWISRFWARKRKKIERLIKLIRALSLSNEWRSPIFLSFTSTRTSVAQKTIDRILRGS